MEINNIMDDTEIKVKGINALYKSLGSAAAMRFLTLLHKTPTDYVEIFAYGSNNGSAYNIQNGQAATWFQGILVKAA